MATNPLIGALDMQRRGFERAAELVEKSAVAADRAEQMAAVEVGTTPSEVVYEENKLELHHYEARTDEQYDVPLLIVYALINRPYILDLQPDRSVVRTLLEQGFDVYMIDWGEPSLLDRSLTLADYVDRYIDNCVDVVRERSGQESINLLGYCMGGTMSAMYAARYPGKVRNLGLMAAGLCFDDTGGVLELWGEADYYSPETVVETFGNVPAEFLDVGFALMDPMDNYVTKYLRLLDNIEDEEFVANFARMERWIGDGIDVAGETYREFLEEIYQDNTLYRNELYLDGEHVDLGNLTMPILQIVGEYDHLIPPGASKPFNEVVPSEDTEVLQARSGHIGLSVSSSSHRELWPQVGAWYAERSGETAEGPAAETAEAAEDVDVAEVEEAADVDEAAEAEEAADVDETATADEADVAEAAGGEDLTVLDGVGDAYAGRLRDAGIDDLASLAAADPAELADAVGVGEARVRDWIEQADERTA